MLRSLCVLTALATTVRAGGYLDDPALRAKAGRTAAATPTAALKYTVDLGEPASTRWAHVAKDFRSKAPAVTKYIEEFVPPTILPVIEAIAADLKGHFPEDYADEMISNSKSLGLPLGEIVIMNLIYQVEKIGNNCSTANNTGPVPNCPPHKKSADKGPGLCTSIVSNDAAGTIAHGRNLDWNIPAAIRSLMVDVTYVKNNKTVFIGSQPVGFVGTLHGAVPGGFSFSLDARDKGGDVGINLIQLGLLKGSMTPTQHARRALEAGSDFEAGIKRLSRGVLINPAYLIVGGVKAGDAAVITRGRDRSVDVWRVGDKSAAANFFLLQTNYDHWEPAPSYDDRRDPGNKRMEALGQAGITGKAVYGVLLQWPTFNHHTDFTAIISAADPANYVTWIWPADA